MISKCKKFNRKQLVLGVASALALGISSNLLADSSEFSVDIKQQNAGSALLKLSKASGVQIMLPKNIGANIQLPALKGQYTVESALDSILSGTGLTYEYASDNAIVIKEEDTGPSQQEQEVDEEVVVTGSRLRNAHPTSPTIIITRDNIDKRGFSSAEDIIRSLPQNYSNMNVSRSITQPVGPDGIPAGSIAQGESAANLRALGSGSTLVLVNGRRTSGSAAFNGAQVNLSNIPAAAIERVEVILDGASAVYGSDAIGGVINFILRKDYVGATTTLRHENSSTDADRFSIDQLVGVSWETGSLTSTLSFTQTDPILTEKTGYTTNDYRSRGGPDLRNGTFTQPGSVSGFGALPLDNDGTSWVLADLSPANLEAAGGDFIRPDQSADTEAKSLSLSLEQELWSGAKGFADVLYTRNETQGRSSAPIVLATVPASNAFNQAGFPLFVFSSHAVEAEAGLIPYGRNESESDSITFNGGIVTELGKGDWQLNVTGSYSTSENQSVVFGYDSFFPTSAEFLDRYNPFGNGTVQDAEAFALIFGPGDPRISKTRLVGISAYVEGSLMELDSGDWRLVFGGEYRVETLSQGGDALSVRDLADTDPSQDIKAVYFESSLPVTRTLNAVVQGRWEQYTFNSTADLLGQQTRPVNPALQTILDVPIDGRSYDNFSPRIGLVWNATDEINLRASWGESFIAPNLTQVVGQLNQAEFGSGRPLFDPIQNVDVVGVFFDSVGNPSLQPQTAETTTIGFDWQPGFVENLQVSVGYSKVKFDDRIDANPTFGFGTEFVLANPDLFPGFAFRDSATNDLISLTSRPINISERNSESIDFTASYGWDSDWGEFSLAVGGVYTAKLEDVIAPGEAPLVLDGTTAGPERISGTVSLDWVNGDYGANLFANYRHSYTNSEATSPSFIATIGESPHIEHYITWDLTGYYQMPDSGWTFRGGARNILDNNFPFHLSFAGPYDTRRVDLRGRVVFFEAQKTFEF